MGELGVNSLNMRRRDTVPAAIVLCCLFRSVTFSQSAPVPLAPFNINQAKQLLQSPSLLDRAWGAYLLSRLDPDKAGLPLIGELRAMQASHKAALALPYVTAEYSYVQVLLDTLIQIKAKPEGELLRKLWPRFHAETLILLIGNAGSNGDILLSLLQEDLTDNQWLAVCNALLGTKSLDLPVLLLKDMRISHTFVVSDDGGGFGDGSGGGSWGCGERYLSNGFPPTGFYKIENYSQNGSVVLAHGPRTIYYFRGEIPTSQQIGWGESFTRFDRQQYRLEYLADLGGVTPTQAQHAFEGRTDVQWTSLTAFQRVAASIMQDQRGEIFNVLEGISKRLDPQLSPEFFSLHLQIQIQVEDRRKDQTTALPVLEAVPVLP